MKKKRIRTSPEEILKHEFGVCDIDFCIQNKITDIVALDLALKFHTSPEFWLNAQRATGEMDA